MVKDSKTIQEALASAAATLADGDRPTQAARLIAASLPVVIEGLSNRTEELNELREQMRVVRRQLRKLQEGQEALLHFAADVMEIIERVDVQPENVRPPPGGGRPSGNFAGEQRAPPPPKGQPPRRFNKKRRRRRSERGE